MTEQRNKSRSKHNPVGLNEAHLALAQQLAHVGSWELDLTNLSDVNQNTLRWSDETFRLLGYVPGEVVPSNELFFKNVHPDDRPAIQNAVARAIHEQIPYNIEHRVLWPDGTERILHEQSTIVYDDHGRPIKMLGVVQDITHRKNFESRLELQCMVLRTMAEGVAFADLHGRITYWNHGARTIFGYAQEEMLGRSVEMLYPAADKAKVGTDIEAILGGKDYFPFFEAVRKDGQRVRIHLRMMVLMDSAGRPAALAALFRDATAEHREEIAVRDSERLYRAVGESIDFGVWVTDSKGRLTHASDSFLTLLGLTRDQNLSDGWINAIHPDERAALLASWREALAQGKPWNLRYRVRGIDGNFYDLLTHGAPVRDEGGNILCWAGLHLDVRLIKANGGTFEEKKEN